MERPGRGLHPLGLEDFAGAPRAPGLVALARHDLVLDGGRRPPADDAEVVGVTGLAVDVADAVAEGGGVEGPLAHAAGQALLVDEPVPRDDLVDLEDLLLALDTSVGPGPAGARRRQGGGVAEPE